jgi:FKBP-type peptidyl-prolyl cis-trans isomerase
MSMRRGRCSAWLLLLAAPVLVAAEEGSLQTDDQKTFYAMGHGAGTGLQRYRMRPDEWAAYTKGLEDALAKRPAAVDTSIWRPRIQQVLEARNAEALAERQALGAEVIARAAAEPGARKTPSGLVLRTLRGGEADGPSPVGTDAVRVRFVGKLWDGTQFDSSDKLGGSAVFLMDGVIACWTEALKTMKVGQEIDLVCPPELAYADQGVRPSIPPGATLQFRVELLEILPGRGVGTPKD